MAVILPRTPLPSDPPPPASADEIARAEQRRVLLEELAEIGMDLARALHRRVMDEPVDDAADAAPAEAPLADYALTFSRLSRAVRLTLAMEERLAAGLSPMKARAAEAQAKRAYYRGEAAKGNVEETVTRVVEAELDLDAETLEGLRAEVEEWLDDDETFGDVADRPLGETVAWICRAMGLTPDWSRWDGESWAAEAEAAVAAAGLGFSAANDDAPVGADAPEALALGTGPPG